MIEPKISFQDLITIAKPIAIRALAQKLDLFLLPADLKLCTTNVSIGCFGVHPDKGTEYSVIKSIDWVVKEDDSDKKRKIYKVSVFLYWEEELCVPAATIVFVFTQKKGEVGVKDAEAVEQ